MQFYMIQKKCRIWGTLKSCTWMMQCNPLLYWLFHVSEVWGRESLKSDRYLKRVLI